MTNSYPNMSRRQAPAVNMASVEQRFQRTADETFQREQARGANITLEQAYVRTVLADPKGYQQYKQAKRQKAFRVAAGID